MRSLQFALAAVALLVLAAASHAGDPGRSYPRVRTFSGGYYGPTQAHYQYQRRYGRPWHGQGRLSTYGYSRSYRSSFGWPSYGSFGFGLPFVGGGFGYSYYGGSTFVTPGCGLFGVSAPPLVSYPLGVAVAPPPLTLASPGVYQPFWSTNPYVNQGLLNNGQLWQQEVPDLLAPQVETLDVEPLGNAPVLPAHSTPQAQLRSLQQQQQGDLRLHEMDYLQAYLRYKEAADTAGERVEPHYLMGIALAGMKRFDKAVRELKLASDLDPGWINSVSLDELLGVDNHIGKVQLKQRVANWALEDAYDADRLYLLGTLLHLDGDEDRARILIDTAVALVGQEQHLTAFRAVPDTLPATHTHPAAPGSPLPPPPVPHPPANQSPVLPTPASQPTAPRSEDIPDAPPEPARPGSGANSPAAPQLPVQRDPVLPSIDRPSGPIFPTSLN